VTSLRTTKSLGPIANPFLNWAGSKRLVAKHLLQHQIPAFQNYHEPFLGSGAFFFALSSVYNIQSATLSDRNRHLASTFQAVKEDPDSVIRSLRLHELLDSKVHFAGILRDLNNHQAKDTANPDRAAGMIYALAQSFHSSWYETPDGRISLSRRSSPRPFRPRVDRVSAASTYLAKADIFAADFKESMKLVLPNDLLFIDAPYLKENDNSDPRSYTAERFTQQDLRELIRLVDSVVHKGTYVIFCWNKKLNGRVFDAGKWLDCGSDNVWISFGSHADCLV
jgi:DNA adenine methylase